MKNNALPSKKGRVAMVKTSPSMTVKAKGISGMPNTIAWRARALYAG